MNKSFLLLILLMITFWGCNSDDDEFDQADPPKKLEVISGNNQIGFPGHQLTDTIKIRIVPNKIEDLNKYWHEVDGSISRLSSQLKIVDNEIHINLVWTLRNYFDGDPNLKIYLFGCERQQKWWLCEPLETIVINAKFKGYWDLVFENPDKNIHRPGDFYDIHFSDDKNGIVVGDYHTSYLKTKNGGDSWEFDNVIDRNLYQLHFTDPLNGIAIGTNNYAYFTSDGGQSFQFRDWNPPIIGHLGSADYFMLSTDNILSVGKEGKLTKSIDSGKSWITYEELPIKSWFYSLVSPDGINCYACGELGRVVKSTDSGNTWVQQNVETNYNLKEIWFWDKENGFAGGDQGCLVKTTNGGKDWKLIKTGITSSIIGIYFANKNTGYLVSDKGEIARSVDGGVNWRFIWSENQDIFNVYKLNKVYFKMPYLFGVEESNVYRCFLGDD